MKLLRLHLQAFGPFTDRWLDLGDGSVGLHLVYGPNEAGKSTTLRALTALRFGIELRSTDNFIHEHARMGLGGVFLDAAGQPVHLVRRKGRGQTLSVLAPDGTTTPATDEVERQLTGGLTRDAWEARFCLDHTRLRRGGAALLAGEGDMGTALFEASAGLRSLPAVMQRLDQVARQQFVPGTRGRNGRINEALRQHAEHQGAQRAAVLRPAEWGELSRRQEEAVASLQSLLARQQSLLARQRQWQELQAVAPLLAALDAARLQVDTLAGAPLLDDESGARRQAALAARAELLQAQAAEAELIGRKRLELAALPAGDQLLQMAAAIDRLAAQADRVDQFRTALVVDTQRLAVLEADAHGQAQVIDPAQPVDAVLAGLPTPVLLADAQARVARLEEAERALARQRRVLADLADEPVAATSLPEPLVAQRHELRRAVEACAREQHTLARHGALPVEIDAARRVAAVALADLGLGDSGVPAQALTSIAPMLDADIDTAMRQADQRASRLRELAQRSQELAATVARDEAERDRLLAQGAVPTAADVLAARQWRDECGRRLFEPGADIDGDLCERYLLSVRQADALVDAWAQDTARAGRLLALEQGLRQSAASIEQVRTESDTLRANEQHQQAQWAAELTRRGLPALPPESLREWQARLLAARQAADHAAALVFEAAQHQPVAEDLACRLTTALQALLPWGATRGLWPAAQGDWAQADRTQRVPDLLTLAREVESVCATLEQQAAAATGARQARDEQRRREQAEEARCLQAAEQARVALLDIGASLRLSAPLCASPDAVRARLAEWARLRATLDEAALVRAERDRSVVLLGDLEQQAQRLATALGGEAVGPDLRAWLDGVVGRLAAARQADQARRLLSQALDDLGARQAGRELALQAVQATLSGLCAAAGMAAGVADVDDLPQAEERSRQRREAQRQCAQVQALLAQASSLDEGVLRERVGAQDAVRVQQELQDCERELAGLEPLVEQARQHDEAARRALDAIDSGDAAAQARAGVEQAGAAVRAAVGPWMRARAAHALLQQAMKQFRERAQGPMLLAASDLFATMTGGEFDRLIGDVDDEGGKSVLRLRRRDGATLGVEALSEGTRDQLYLALRLAAWQLQRQRGAADLPVALDDVLMTSDDERVARMLRALADHARGAQVLVFTHHRHLLDIATRTLGPADCAVQTLGTA